VRVVDMVYVLMATLKSDDLEMVILPTLTQLTQIEWFPRGG
jgi:hypothetical protein